MTTERLLLADPPTGRISARYNKCVRIHFTQHHYDFIICIEINGS
jgi:hypothetical protein